MLLNDTGINSMPLLLHFLRLSSIGTGALRIC